MFKRFHFTGLLAAFLLLPVLAAGQGHLDRLHTIDVLQYNFEIHLNDHSNLLHGKADIRIEFKQDCQGFNLDLTGVRPSGKGMRILDLKEDDGECSYEHIQDEIRIQTRARVGEIKTYTIVYEGIPSDGLIISTNKFGDRTFFADNWPNRGHHWLPLVDHPSDKATVQFLVEVPSHYSVISNGILAWEERSSTRYVCQWVTRVPLSTKLMVIGVSPFAVEHSQSASGVPVSTWVYPQNREEGFYDFRPGLQVMDYFESLIGPYPYAKLAHVQSKTVYGGMENASCIFYNEGAVTGRREDEDLIAHEMAHQWFGDGVSEADWHHIWLSEGFATYLENMYMEHRYGEERLTGIMQRERDTVLAYGRETHRPILDTTLAVGIKLLSPNSYEKAGWVLHMLRAELGDSLFRDCLQSFYRKFTYGNALTEDFQAVVDSVSGRDFGPFFDQWLKQPGQPLVSARVRERGKQTFLEVQQHQVEGFFFPLEVEFLLEDGRQVRETFRVEEKQHRFPIDPGGKIRSITLDPRTRLLFAPFGS
ncbi:MAG: M1 family metallopeptidase [Bacteroidales bacterium]